MNSTRTLFLDYDGVLHPDAAYVRHGRPELRAAGHLFMWANYLIEALAPHPDIQIVLSTSWAREFHYARAKKHLPKELQPRVIGATWHSSMRRSDEFRPLDRMTWWDLASRYAQIKRYVDRARLVRWLAIDDQPDGWADADLAHLIRTDSDTGLSDTGVRAQLLAWLDATHRDAVVPRPEPSL